MVWLGVIWNWLSVPVDISASLSRRSGSSWDVVCVMASMVSVLVWVSVLTQAVEGWGTVSVDVSASLSEHGGSSQGTVWATVSAEVDVVWVQESVGMLTIGPVCMPSSTWIHVRGLMHLSWPCFVAHASRSAVFPRSSPSFSSFSYASSLAFCSCSSLSCSKTLFSGRFEPS